MLTPKQCSRCGTAFECGAKADACWCQQLPSLPATAIDAAQDCLCPRCLEAATAPRSKPEETPRDVV